VKWVLNPFSGKFDAVNPYFKENGATLELWYKENLVHSWTIEVTAPVTGNPIGLLLALTYNFE